MEFADSLPWSCRSFLLWPRLLEARSLKRLCLRLNLWKVLALQRSHFFFDRFRAFGNELLLQILLALLEIRSKLVYFCLPVRFIGHFHSVAFQMRLV